MKYILFALLFIASSSFACEVNLPHQLVVINYEPSGKKAFRFKECDDKAMSDLHHFITNLEGRVASYQIKELMSSKGHEISIQPHSIKVQQMRSLIREQLPLPAGIQVKSSQSLNMPGAFALPAGDKLEINCSSCLFGSQQPINVTIHGFDGSRQSFIVNADFKKMVKAYRILAPLSSFSDISRPELLKEEYVESIPHTDLVTDLSTLKFYKTNKPLKAGELLKQSDLNALNIVKAGLKTEVVLENQVIRIKTQGISRSNGTIGELVEVYHPQKNKKYQGKVIDINKVLVEL